ncbi:hypothetical protein [Aliarcobacter butzleri]|uniref:hypothetical protein n=1 Tax=Aliarcobacter butzleri TaxID=28197 RepID=UPI00189E3F91|nr:hypothetical protein [Aliarcobacter butzleri]MBF7065401.1 hypothetical protein [Aliarcobacter butzleri]MBP7226929.1 hypothetical protein [Aliarcobacter sp.]
MTEKSISIISILIAIFIGLYAISENRKLAIESGSLQKPILQAKIGSLYLTQEEEHRIIFGTNEQQQKEGLVISPFTIEVKNAGDKVLENLYVTYRYHSMQKRNVLELLDFNLVGAISQDSISKKFSESGMTQYVSYHIPNINPNVSIGIDEPFVLRETKFYNEIELKDGLLPITITYAFKFQVSISSATVQHQDYNFSATIITSDNLDDLLLKFKNQVISNEIKDFRSQSSFFSYLGTLLFNNIEQKAVLIYPNNTKVENEKAVIFFPEANKVAYRTVWYKLAQWNRLF